MRTTTALTLVATLLVAAPAFAKEGPHGLSDTDQQFINGASMGNVGEVHLGAVAAARGTTPAIREFARWMISTHSFANRELATIVERLHGDKPSIALDAKTEATMKKLQNLQGEAFDTAYLQAAEKDHEEAVGKVEAEAEHGDDYLVKTFAANFAPAVKEHLAQVKSLIADMNKENEKGAAKNADMKAASGGMTGPSHKTTSEAEKVREQHTN